MKLDYKKIKEESENKRINYYLVIKRKINYRKCNQKEMDCRFCENVRYSEGKRKHCIIIGIAYDKNSEVDHFHICTNYKLLRNEKKHDYRKYIEKLKEKEDV